MTPWQRRWVKLYRETSSKWRSLPLSARGLGAELLRVVDSEGRLYVGSERPTEALARLLGAHPSERRRLALDFAALQSDGYLVVEADWITIVNFCAAQSEVSESTKRVRAHRAARSSGDVKVTSRSSQGDVKVESLRSQGETSTQCVNCKNNGESCLFCRREGVTETSLKRREEIETEATPPPPSKGDDLSTAKAVDPRDPQIGPLLALELDQARDVAGDPKKCPDAPSALDREVARRQSETRAAVERIFEHWRKKMKKNKSVLDPRRVALISGALKRHGEGDCLRAIDGCASDPWSCGANDRGRRFDSIELILRDSAHVERYRDMCQAGALVGSDFDGHRDAAAFDAAIDDLAK